MLCLPVGQAGNKEKRAIHYNGKHPWQHILSPSQSTYSHLCASTLMDKLSFVGIQLCCMYKYTHVCVCFYVCMCMYNYVCMYVCMYVCIICMYVCMHAWWYVYNYVYMYIHMPYKCVYMKANQFLRRYQTHSTQARQWP